MLALLWLAPGFLFLPAATPEQTVVTFATLEAASPRPRLTFADNPTSRDAPASPTAAPGAEIRAASEELPPPVAEPEPAPSSIFGRPWLADRRSLSWVIGTGPKRFNLIDWESRPNNDHLWWLGRWPSGQDVQLYAQLGFNFHWWAGPAPRERAPGELEPAPHLPAYVFDLYVDLAWAQRWTDRLTSEVRVRPGLYTDFRTTPPDAFRAPGQAVALFRATPELQLVGGVEHVQRNDVQVLPIAGVLWQPTPSCELRLVFPEPKAAFELSPRHHLWGYVAAEYGGGRWTYKNRAGHSERVESSDYRLIFGLEWRKDYCAPAPLLSETWAAFLECGYVFERHLRFDDPADNYEPDAAWMIRFGTVW